MSFVGAVDIERERRKRIGEYLIKSVILNTFIFISFITRALFLLIIHYFYYASSSLLFALIFIISFDKKSRLAGYYLIKIRVYKGVLLTPLYMTFSKEFIEDIDDIDMNLFLISLNKDTLLYYTGCPETNA